MKNILLAVLYVLAAARSFAFGHEGHQTVAAIAETMLAPKTKAAVAAILENETMLDAATWPDDIKPPYGKFAQTTEAKAFNSAHKDNKSWHFVNFPVGAKRYTASSKFAYPHDIVHLINGCITVLEGGEFEGLDQKDALRYVIHLVGDIHQPLHVVAGYYDLADPTHPKLAKVTKPEDNLSDAGGNALYYGKSDELHAFWDTTLVNAIFTTNDPAVLAAKVMEGAPAPDTYKTSGGNKTWAAKWAGDSMTRAAATYPDIVFGEATIAAHGDLKTIAISFTPSTQAYKAKNTPILKEQLRKAGVHLGQLLNSIDWDN